MEHLVTSKPSDNLDLLWGAEAIAKALNMKNRRQAYHLLETGKLPGRRVGKVWVTSRSALAKHFSDMGVAA